MIQRVRSERYFQDSPLGDSGDGPLPHRPSASQRAVLCRQHAWPPRDMLDGQHHQPGCGRVACAGSKQRRVAKSARLFRYTSRDGWIEAMRAGIPRLLPEPRELRDRMQPHNIHPETHADPWFERLQVQRMRYEESPRARPLCARPDARGACDRSAALLTLRLTSAV